MATSKAKKKTYGDATFTVDDVDIERASDQGILRRDIVINLEPSSPDFGRVYNKQDNISSDAFESQRAIQNRCKAFAQRSRFQLYVKSSSTKPGYSGNAKYACKLLNRQQFYDSTADITSLEYPFFLNVYSTNGKWKATAANLSHNHFKHVGSSRLPCVEGSVPRPDIPLHNTTQSMDEIAALIEAEVVLAHAGSISTFKGVEVITFLKSKGIVIRASAASRVKQSIDDKLRGNWLQSYQNLEAGFALVAEKNHGSIWAIDREVDDTTFKGAWCISVCRYPHCSSSEATYRPRRCSSQG